MTQSKSLFFKQALKTLGWQGGTIHQVINVLRQAKLVVDINKHYENTGDWNGDLGKAIYNLTKAIYN